MWRQSPLLNQKKWSGQLTLGVDSLYIGPFKSTRNAHFDNASSSWNLTPRHPIFGFTCGHRQLFLKRCLPWLASRPPRTFICCLGCRIRFQSDRPREWRTGLRFLRSPAITPTNSRRQIFGNTSSAHRSLRRREESGRHALQYRRRARAGAQYTRGRNGAQWGSFSGLFSTQAG